MSHGLFGGVLSYLYLTLERRFLSNAPYSSLLQDVRPAICANRSSVGKDTFCIYFNCWSFINARYVFNHVVGSHIGPTAARYPPMLENSDKRTAKKLPSLSRASSPSTSWSLPC